MYTMIRQYMKVGNTPWELNQYSIKTSLKSGSVLFYLATLGNEIDIKIKTVQNNKICNVKNLDVNHY